MKKKEPYDRSVYQALTLIMQFGINMVVPIGMMCALGIYLDRRLGTSYWTVVLFFVGAVAGGQNIYRMAKRFFMRSEAEELSAYGEGRKKAARPAGGRERDEAGKLSAYGEGRKKAARPASAGGSAEEGEPSVRKAKGFEEEKGHEAAGSMEEEQ